MILHRIFWFLTIIVLMPGVAIAQKAKRSSAQEKIELVKLTAVAGQEIRIRRAFALEKDCTPYVPNRVAVITPPQKGQLLEQEIEVLPDYAKENPRSACNNRRIKAAYAVYKAPEGFAGEDKFRFALVFYDGTASHYDVRVTVWK